MSYFSSNLKKIRGERSQKTFALELSVPVNSISSYENGKTKPTLDFLVTLAEREKISLDWLIFNKEEISVENLDNIKTIQLQLEEEQKLNRRLTNQLLDLTELKKEEKTG